MVLGWGSAFGALREAVEELNSRGGDFLLVHFQDLWPQKWEEIADFLRSARRLITVENNAWGQLGKLLAQETGILPGRHVARYDGRPFVPEELVEVLLREA